MNRPLISEDGRPLNGIGLPYDCDYCHGAGEVARSTGPRTTEYLPCPRCGAKRIEKSVQALYPLPEHFGRITLEKMRKEPGEEVALARAKSVAERLTGWLNLVGPYGTGKTLMLVGVVNAFKAAGRSAVYMPAHSIADAAHRALDVNTEFSLSSLERSFRYTDLWAIDELDKAGFEKDTYAANMFWQWVNWRYDHKLPCAFAWNDSRLVHGGLLSRMNDGFWGDEFGGGIITLTAQDQRPRNRPARRTMRLLDGRTGERVG